MKIRINYDGDYPNLCSGQLIVIVTGYHVEEVNKEWIFPSYCMSSGGSVNFDDDWSEEIEEGEWSINEFPKGFPEELQQAVIDEVNNNVTYGCCGGCV